MNARKKPEKTQGTGKPSARLASKAKQPKQKKPLTEQIPDLEAVYYDVFDAYAIVRCASRTIDESHSDEDRTAASRSLRQGVEALAKAVDNLEVVWMQVSRIRRAGGAS